jgi:DNA-binding transcriptional MerR regulator
VKGDEVKVVRKKSPPKDLLKIGEMARLAGVLPSTIRYYTEIGLLEPAGTTIGGQRLYSKEDTLSKIRMIKNIERQHLPLQTIKKIIEDHRAKAL